MKKLFLRFALALSVALSVLSSVSHAQDAKFRMVRSLVIKNNQVRIDGRKVEGDALPETVHLDGVTISYSFIGIDVPVVSIGDNLYSVQNDHLELLSTTSAKERARQEFEAQDERKGNGWIVDSDRGQYYTFQGERLEVVEAIPRLLNQANTLYLHDLQERNISLFMRLAHERELKFHAERLAAAVRLAPNDSVRTRNAQALTLKLAEIFELKQQNRRQEIALFEVELEQLRARLEKRADYKQELIRKRFTGLTGLTVNSEP